MSLTIETAARVFRHNGRDLQDPDPKQTPEQVKDFYANIYPELTTAAIEGPKHKGANAIYEFRKAVGTKGNNIPGWQLISEERQRQVLEEGFNTIHDDEHTDHELVFAAIAYAEPEQLHRVRQYPDGAVVLSDVWPATWDQRWDKRERHDLEDDQTPLQADDYPIGQRIRNLVKAGALIAAEIDRLQRKAQRDVQA